MRTELSDRDGERALVRVVRTVADERGVEPTDLEPPLGTVVDTDALNKILRSDTTSQLTVAFEYAGCHVTVTPDDVSVTRLAGGQ